MNEKTVCILLSTYNGEKFLETQLNSLINQTYENKKIIIRDDGSSDSTLDILKKYQDEYPYITVISEKNVGVKKSFYKLLQFAVDKGFYFSFCDQDDVWLPEKVEKAVEAIEKQFTEEGVLYCSALNLVDGELNFIKKTKDLVPGKTNAVIQNIVTGCTMVLDKPMAQKVLAKEPDWDKTEMHDSWFYVVSSFLGNIIFDSNSYINYRQHGNNEVGLPTNKIQVVQNSIVGFRNEIKSRIHRKQLEEFYKLYSSNIYGEDKKLVELLISDNLSIKKRYEVVVKNKLYKQSKLKTLVFRVLYITKFV